MSKNKENLYLVYSFTSVINSSGDFDPAAYHIRGVYHDRGAIPQNELQEFAKSVTHEHFLELRFSSLDEIKNFSERLFQDYPVEALYLLSSQDFNLALEASGGANQLSANLIKYGEKFENAETAKSKGFLSKFFK